MGCKLLFPGARIIAAMKGGFRKLSAPEDSAGLRGRLSHSQSRCAEMHAWYSCSPLAIAIRSRGQFRSGGPVAFCRSICIVRENHPIGLLHCSSGSCIHGARGRGCTPRRAMKWRHPIEKPGWSMCWWFSFSCLAGETGHLLLLSSLWFGIGMAGSWVHSDVCGGCHGVNGTCSAQACMKRVCDGDGKR